MEALRGVWREGFLHIAIKGYCAEFRFRCYSVQARHIDRECNINSDGRNECQGYGKG